MSMTPIPEAIKGERNASVLIFLNPLSAHSDISEPLHWAQQKLPGTKLYCPDWHSYLYVLAYTHQTVFAFAIGMNSIGVRLPPELWKAAGEDGGDPCEAVGPEWTLFKPFGHTAPDIHRWLKAAYHYTLNPPES
jgi:hypothetical protein